MSKDDTTQSETSLTTSTETRSKSADELWAEASLAERIKPSRQRNLTPSQRKERAETLRLFRRARSGDPGLLLRS
jgi:hypothetical protein